VVLASALVGSEAVEVDPGEGHEVVDRRVVRSTDVDETIADLLEEQVVEPHVLRTLQREAIPRLDEVRIDVPDPEVAEDDLLAPLNPRSLSKTIAETPGSFAPPGSMGACTPRSPRVATKRI
jgi:hypothetical protein